MGKVIYLMRRVEQLHPEEIIRLLNRCLYALDLKQGSILDLKLEIYDINGKAWAVFFRKEENPDKSEEITPLGLPDEELQKLLADYSKGRENNSTAKEFKDGATIVFRLNGSLPLDVRSLIELAHFHAVSLRGSDFYPNNFFLSALFVRGIPWCILRQGKSPAEKFLESVNFNSFLKDGDSKDERKYNEGKTYVAYCSNPVHKDKGDGVFFLVSKRDPLEALQALACPFCKEKDNLGADSLSAEDFLGWIEEEFITRGFLDKDDIYKELDLEAIKRSWTEFLEKDDPTHDDGSAQHQEGNPIPPPSSGLSAKDLAGFSGDS